MLKRISYAFAIFTLLGLASLAQARAVLGETRNSNTTQAIEGSGQYGVLSSDHFHGDVSPNDNIFEGENAENFNPEEPDWPSDEDLQDGEDNWGFGSDIITDDEVSEESKEEFIKENREDNLDPSDEIKEDNLSYLNDLQNDTETTLMSETKKTDENRYEVAVIQTSKGQMIIEFWPDVAPKTVENFKSLANKGFYDGTAFHRIVKDFMIQGGDPLSVREDKKPLWGTGGPGYTIDAEFNDKKHVKGVVSMARATDPDSAGSQFFICLADAPFLDGQYTAFGKLVSGEDVLDSIGEVETEYNQGNEKSLPLERIEVKSIKIMDAKELQESI